MEARHRQRQGDKADELGGHSLKHASPTASTPWSQRLSAAWSSAPEDTKLV
jgi:hypothetical protein